MFHFHLITEENSFQHVSLMANYKKKGESNLFMTEVADCYRNCCIVVLLFAESFKLESRHKLTLQDMSLK